MTERISEAVIQELTSIRRGRKVSQQELANRMTEAGYPIKRSVIANLESGRRVELSVDHLAIACKALGIDATAILRQVTDPCPNCKGEPPIGFSCNVCTASGSA
ncbi:helix-turn-helix domain-containing protein [Streptomyces sp. NPDC003857]